MEQITRCPVCRELDVPPGIHRLDPDRIYEEEVCFECLMRHKTTTHFAPISKEL